MGSEVEEEPAMDIMRIAIKRTMPTTRRASLVFLSKKVVGAGAGLTEIWLRYSKSFILIRV